MLAHSVIMSEDGQFCFHRGVDLGELQGVVDDALAGEATRGASTITMQTVKNLYPLVTAAGHACARSSNCRWPSISTR